MILSDFFNVIEWWSRLLIIGVIFIPFTTALFPQFLDRGYIFSKVFGILFISYAVFLLGITKTLPFNTQTIFLIIGFFALINTLILNKYWKTTIEQFNNRTIVIFLFEEFLFLASLLFWSYIRAHSPNINGLEKFMDFGFVNSILRSDYFPPKDMWFTPFSINYYYFGHLVTAVLTKLSGIPPNITFNLMIATLFSFTFTASFSIGANLIHSLSSKRRGDTTGKAPDSAHALFGTNTNGALAGGKVGAGPRAIIAGLLTAFLVTLTDNLHTLYTLFKPYQNENPIPFWQLAFSPQTFPNSYWYPNATRFIYNTIHEFPSYSFVVSDLHGHVLSIPIVLTIIAVLLSIFLTKKVTPLLLLIAFLLSTAYMTNAWDGIIYFLLTALIILFIMSKERIKSYIPHILLILGGFLLFSLPFSLNFKPFVSGIGVLCMPKFITDIGSLGPFLFEADHCQRSPVYQLAILYGFFYFFVVSFIVWKFGHWKLFKNWKLKIGNLNESDKFIIVLIFLSTVLIIIPEFIYVKDIYPAHYRANTMFKLVYQAFIMLSITSAYIIMRIISHIKSLPREALAKWGVFLIFTFLFLILVMIYPYFAVTSYYGNLQTYKGLDGISYLKNQYPTDYKAILWLNKNIKGQPVILEAQGDSYTDYERVSANTGLPTILGWLVHEWLWRGSYDVPSPRIEEVKALYESSDIQKTKGLTKKYNIELVFIGDLEKEKYPQLNEEKFEQLGKILFQSGKTTIYRLDKD